MVDITTNNPLDDLLLMWKEDSKIDKLQASDELQKIGSLHAKYLSIMSMNRRSLKELERKTKRFRKLKWEYYTGKMDQETLKKLNWTPFPHILKADISVYMEGDKDMLELQKMKDLHEEIVDVCSAIIKELGARTWQLKDIITWERFISGVH